MENHENEGKTGHVFSLSLSHYKIQCDRLDPIQQEHGVQPQRKRPSFQLLASVFLNQCNSHQCKHGALFQSLQVQVNAKYNMYMSQKTLRLVKFN